MYVLGLGIVVDEAGYLNWALLGDSALMDLHLDDVAGASAESIQMYAVRITENGVSSISSG
jgi:hypothetical protein